MKGIDPMLFNLWFGLTCSDVAAELLSAILFWRLGTRLGRYGALVFIGFAFESLVAALSLFLFWPDEVVVAPAFALSRSGGRFVKSAVVWVLAVYLLGFFNGIHKTEVPGR